MTNEELQKLKALAKNAQEGARNGWPFYPEALAKAMTPDVARKLIELAERTTQPAQDRCCDHDSDCAVHNAPAYPVGPCDCTLSEKPAQDQVAAVRAVPDNINQFIYKLINEHFNYGTVYGEDAKQHYATAVEIAEFAAELLYGAAPSPQPELSGNIDTPELRELLRSLHACPTETLEIDLDETIASINAWKNAACTVAYSKGYADMNTIAGDALILYSKRATDAEAKLAAIQEGADIRMKYADYFATIERAQECLRKITEFKFSESSVQRIAPPSQSDTSGLPG